jgi:transcriptional regulator with XRE-family HTH domain
MSVTTTMTVRPVGLIETLRRSRGWHQADLAARAELHPSVVSRIEAGLIPGSAVRARLASALEVPESTLWPTLRNDHERPAKALVEKEGDDDAHAQD